MYNTCMHDVNVDTRGQLMALLHTASTVQNHAEVKLAAVGLSLPKLAALTALSEAGESMPLSQLAERLSCVKSNITQPDLRSADSTAQNTAGELACPSHQ